MNGHRRNSSGGFTLAELLIVVAIIAVLVAIAIPVFGTVLGKSRSAACAANRRSLLSEVTVRMLTEGETGAEAFAAVYPGAAGRSGCPDGGSFSWSDGEVVCSEHSGGSRVTLTWGGAEHKVILADGKGGRLDTKQYQAGEKITIVQGNIYRAGDDYYIAKGTQTNEGVSGDYEDYLRNKSGTYGLMAKVDFTKLYTPADIDVGNSGNMEDWRNIYDDGRYAIGAVYQYGDKLYVQNTSFAGVGNVTSMSTDPEKNTGGFWTLLGTVK